MPCLFINKIPYQVIGCSKCNILFDLLAGRNFEIVGLERGRVNKISLK